LLIAVLAELAALDGAAADDFGATAAEPAIDMLTGIANIGLGSEAAEPASPPHPAAISSKPNTLVHGPLGSRKFFRMAPPRAMVD
jgi:hypothetical protein